MGQVTRAELENNFGKDILVNSDGLKVSPVDVEIEGRTLVNLLGRAGNAIYKQAFNASYEPLYDGDAFNFVNIEQEKYIEMRFNAIEGKYYLLVYDYIGDPFNGYYSPAHILHNIGHSHRDNHTECIGKTKFTGYATRDSTIAASKGSVICGTPYSNNAELYQPQSFKIRNLRVYEISQEIHDKINVDPEYTGDKLVEKYPYVDDVKCVVNPYIECKENLLDDIKWYMGSTDAGGTNEYVHDANGLISSILKIDDGIEYIVSCPQIPNYEFIIWEYDGINHNPRFVSVDNTMKFTPDKGKFYRAVFRNKNASYIMNVTDNIYVKKTFTLVKGSIAKTYDECHSSQIMFETHLYEGEKITRNNNGSYIKNSEMDEIEISNMTFQLAKNENGYRHIWIKDILPNKYVHDTIAIPVRFDGYILPLQYPDMETESVYISLSTNIDFCIPDTLSGWGPDYTPTQEEIKAYFLGWRLGPTSSRDILYDGNGVKAWYKLYSGTGGKSGDGSGLYPVVNEQGIINRCPSYMNDMGYKPYRLIYKKEIPCLEEVKTHGSLVIKSDSDINVSSGLVINECVIGDPVNNYIHFNRGIFRKFRHCNLKCRMSNIVKCRSSDNKIVAYNLGRYSDDSEIISGKHWVETYTNEPELFVDYIMYNADTVNSYNYRITNTEPTKDVLKKTMNELSNISKDLSITKQKLDRANYKISQLSNPNLLINGDFQVWQRGDGFSNTDNVNNVGRYTADRWIAYTNDFINITKHHKGVELISSNQTNNFRQVIPLKDLHIDIKKGLTISTKIDTVTSGSVHLDFYHPSISKYEPVSHPIYLSESGDISVFSVSTGDLSLIDAYDDSMLIITICITPDTRAIIEWVKLEHGDVATPFVSKTYAQELVDCQRYFEVINSIVSISSATCEQGNYCSGIRFSTKKRIVPTIKYTHGANIINHVIIDKSKLSHNSVECTIDMFEPIIDMAPNQFKSDSVMIIRTTADAEIY